MRGKWKSALFTPQESGGTIIQPLCVTIKMAAAAMALHGGQKETPFPLLISFVITLTLISPPPFPLHCDVINTHEHNLHMIIVFVFLFVSK